MLLSLREKVSQSDSRQSILQRQKNFCLQGKNVPVKKMSYVKTVYGQLTVIVFIFKLLVKANRRKESSVGSFASKEAIVGTVVNLLGRTCSTEHIFANGCRWNYTIKESVLQNEQACAALLCNCLEGKFELMDGAYLFLL